MPFSLLLRTVLKCLVLPPGGPLLLMLAGALGLRWHRLAGRTLLACGVLALWVLSTPQVALSLGDFVADVAPLDLSRPTHAQAIVILGGAARYVAPEYGEDALGDDTLQRVSYGAYVAARLALPVLVSGGAAGAPRAVGAAMRRTLARDYHLAVRWSEEQSIDTRENARDSAAMLRPEGVRRIVLVTGALHMRRALREFRQAGLDPVAAPVDFPHAADQGLLAWMPSIQAEQLSYAALYELLGALVQRLRGDGQ